jgi:hypothetical protein
MTARIFVVRIKRSDREGVDPVHIRAFSRQDAETFVREMYGDRLLSIVRPNRGRFSRNDQRIADHVDGFDRDDLGESPDY